MIKRFLLFAGNDYYPEGGANDFKGSYDSIEDAVKAHNPKEFEYDGGWANIFDLENEKIVKQFHMSVWYNHGEEIL